MAATHGTNLRSLPPAAPNNEIVGWRLEVGPTPTRPSAHKFLVGGRVLAWASFHFAAQPTNCWLLAGKGKDVRDQGYVHMWAAKKWQPHMGQTLDLFLQ